MSIGEIASGGSSIAPEMVARVGVCSWSLQPESPEALVHALQRLRVSTVQLAISPLVHEPTRWSDAVRRLRDANVHIASGMMAMKDEDYATPATIARTGGVRPTAHWPANFAHCRAIAQLAAREHIMLITFHAGFIPHDGQNPERAVMLDRLGQIADLFAQHQLVLALETGQESAETLDAALRELNRPNLGVNLDPANMILYGSGDPLQAMRVLRPHIRQMHVKDAVRPPQTPRDAWGTEVPVGTGQIDWARIIAGAQSADAPIRFMIERESGNQREQDMARARDMLLTFPA